ncbi:olfactory receptor 51F2-like [Betta splendens]|uniref:Olfactory receptor 51F2-like n=1 Tax=Betta splendens TaxID=158456 RepID=A0A6P7PDQ2_BETSP|nr:olfactory receptor 51F2-like [Betta splendens]
MSQAERSASIINTTFVRPAAFYINGFTDIPHAQYYYVFLCFVYIMTVVGNGFLMSVIYLVKTLHSAKYMIVFSLALTDLCGSTALIPKVLDTFLFDRRYIVYEACLSYMFFVYFFACLQSLTLLMMGFDRFVAICFPLSYHRIVTKPAVAVMLLCVWGLSLSVLGVLVGLINRLSFCGSLVIPSFFCDHGPVYRLACNDTSLNYIMGILSLILFDCIPLMLISLTYVCIAVALSKITSGVEQHKALKTCTSHVILVAIFFLPIVATNLAVMSYLHPNTRIINSTLTHTVPALLNPIIYSLKTKEVMKAFKKLWKNVRPYTVIELKLKN